MRPVSADTGHVPAWDEESNVTPPAHQASGVCGQISTNGKMDFLPRPTALGHACACAAHRALTAYMLLLAPACSCLLHPTC
eukprot:4122185-Prymnesium_polylepis.1